MFRKVSNYIKVHKKTAIITSVIFLTVAGVGIFVLNNSQVQPGSMEWKKQRYTESCERGVREGGMDNNTTEYAICTRDLGYDIKGIEPEPTPAPTATPQSTITQPSIDSSSDDGKKGACASLRATSLDDMIKSNQQNGISEEDTRITYQSGIAQCNDLGY